MTIEIRSNRKKAAKFKCNPLCRTTEISDSNSPTQGPDLLEYSDYPQIFGGLINTETKFDLSQESEMPPDYLETDENVRFPEDDVEIESSTIRLHVEDESGRDPPKQIEVSLNLALVH